LRRVQENVGFRDWLISVGYIQPQTSPVLFIRTELDGNMLIISFYTDDGIFFGTP
jgi:hypothetical protein